jgi:hypothetical protein
VRIFAIDPGSENSAAVNYDTDTDKIVRVTIQHNEAIVVGCRLHGMDVLENDTLDWDTRCDKLVIEKIASYGMPVGEEVFATCRWTGRFIQSWIGTEHDVDRQAVLITRGEVKMYLCNSMRAKDANIRQALMDRFPKSGLDGKKRPSVIGTKKNPGPLLGLHDDMWAALAVAVTFAGKIKQG